MVQFNRFSGRWPGLPQDFFSQVRVVLEHMHSYRGRVKFYGLKKPHKFQETPFLLAVGTLKPIHSLQHTQQHTRGSRIPRCGESGGAHSKDCASAALKRSFTPYSFLIPEVYLTHFHLGFPKHALCFLFTASDHPYIKSFVQQLLNAQLPHTTSGSSHDYFVPFLLQNTELGCESG